MARASTPSLLGALPAKLQSTRTRAASLGGTSTTATRRPPPTSPPGDYRARRRSLPLRATLWEPSCPSFERPQAGALLWEGGTLEELACGFVDRGDG